MSTALELRGVTKRFGAVPALADVDLTVGLGEVHCVLGENGAGKSTLCHLVYGAAQPDAGTLRLFGEDYAPRRPVDALRHGVAMVHQHFSLVPSLSVGENLLLGKGPRVRLRRRDVAERVARIEADYGLAVDLDARTGDLTVGERQSVEIVKALLRDPRLVILDEPTAVLGPHDLEALLATCRRIADAGRSVVLVTHKLGEIEAVGDTATVLRGGRVAGTGHIGELGRERLVSMMIGRPLDEIGSLAVANLDVLDDPAGAADPAGPAAPAGAPGTSPVVVIEDLRVLGHAGAQELAGLDLVLAPGEIVGIAGVEGTGQSELVAALSGAVRAGGRFTVDGTELLARGPRDRTAAGVGVIPEDRHREGCIPSMTLADNLFLGSLARFRRHGLLDRAAVRRAAAAAMDEHAVVASGPDAALGTLSGGNQQKVVVARELAIDPLRFLVAAHPTRGLDVGAVDAVLRRIRQAAAGGAAVLLVSSELPELLLLCDRILVAYRGRLLGPVLPGSPSARAEIGDLGHGRCHGHRRLHRRRRRPRRPRVGQGRPGLRGDHPLTGRAAPGRNTPPSGAARHNGRVTPTLWRTLGEQAEVWPGRNWPLGTTWSAESTNFAVHAPNATAVWLCVALEGPGGAERRYALTEQSLGIWHGALPSVAPGTRYGYRVEGPDAPEEGMRFDPSVLLLDPYGLAVSGEAGSAWSVVVDPAFDWQGESPIRRRYLDTVIYELHVKGFTKLHDRIPEELRGTYAGLGHPVVTQYLNDLGVTAVELLPVHQFFSEPALVERGTVNYWGYNSIGYFAPHAAYSSSGDRGQQVTEFKEMVRSLHAAGIEVILDVVYNHTAEAGPDGPTYSFRGLDDRGFYRRNPPGLDGDPDYDDTYWDVTGCGNTVNSEDPLALRLILDSLRYWVTEMHVDGFRFDLMSAITRTAGPDAIRVDMACKLLIAIGQDPVLRHVKLIAEPWDVSMDGYLVGGMPPPWVEWNDQYRDTIRDFWRGQSGGTQTVATRLAGSSDLYADDGRSAYNSVNFVTAHDGFTVRDLVSYDHKHNEANGEDNRDGSDNNRSWNHGVEGETDDPDIVALRRRQAANLMATLCLSNGVPMLTAGDERGRTQGGNNNPYCQDNEISWVDWSADDAWLDVYEVTRAALRLRREHPALRQRHWFEGRPTIVGGPKDLAWLHPSGREMTDEDWYDAGLPTVGMFVSGRPLRTPGPRGEQQIDTSFLLWFHAGADPVEVYLPDNDWVHAGAVVLSTDPGLPAGTRVEVGEVLTIGARSVVVMQEADA